MCITPITLYYKVGGRSLHVQGHLCNFVAHHKIAKLGFVIKVVLGSFYKLVQGSSVVSPAQFQAIIVVEKGQTKKAVSK